MVAMIFWLRVKADCGSADVATDNAGIKSQFISLIVV